MAPVIDQVLIWDKEKRPFASDILQIEVIKKQVDAIILDEDFSDQLEETIKAKIKLGYCREEEVVYILKKATAQATAKFMKNPKGKQPEKIECSGLKLDEVVTFFYDGYLNRIAKGGNQAKDRIKETLRTSGQDHWYSREIE